MQGAGVVRDEQHVGIAAVEHEHRLAGQRTVPGRDAVGLAAAYVFGNPDAEARLTARDTGQPLLLLCIAAGAGECHWRHHRRRDEGARVRRCPPALGDEGGFQEAEPHTAVLLGDEDAMDAEFAESLPEVFPGGFPRLRPRRAPGPGGRADSR